MLASGKLQCFSVYFSSEQRIIIYASLAVDWSSNTEQLIAKQGFNSDSDKLVIGLKLKLWFHIIILWYL